MPAPTRSVYVHGPNTLYAQTQRDYDYNRHKHELEELLLPYVTRRMAPHPPPERAAGLRPWMQPAAEELTRAASELDARALQARRRARTKQKRRDALRARELRRRVDAGLGRRETAGSSTRRTSSTASASCSGTSSAARARGRARARGGRSGAFGLFGRTHWRRARSAKNARSAVTGFPGTGGGRPPGTCSAARAPQPGGELVSRVAGRERRAARQGLFSKPERIAATTSRRARATSSTAAARRSRWRSRARTRRPVLALAQRARRARAREDRPSPFSLTHIVSVSRRRVETKSYMDRLAIDSRAPRGSAARATRSSARPRRRWSPRAGAAGCTPSATTTAARAPARSSSGSPAPVVGRAARESNV